MMMDYPTAPESDIEHTVNASELNGSVPGYPLQQLLASMPQSKINSSSKATKSPKKQVANRERSKRSRKARKKQRQAKSRKK